MFGLTHLTTAVTAHAGGGQASATVIGSHFNEVSTVATANDSVALPASIEGMDILISNYGANALNVFPVNGGTERVDSLAANTAYSLAANSKMRFVCDYATHWMLVPNC
jgi:hypothetical protein